MDFQLGLPKFIIGTLGLPAWLALAMEYQKNRSILREETTRLWRFARRPHYFTCPPLMP